MLKWRATRHSKAEKLNFVLQKCKCSLGNSRWLILKSGYHAENPWKTRYFYFEALFGYHKVSWWYPKFSQKKVWYFSFKMTCRTYLFGFLQHKLFRKTKGRQINSQGCTKIKQIWYSSCIKFLVVLNVCVSATIDCHERIKDENDLQRFVIVYFIFTYKSKFFIKV